MLTYNNEMCTIYNAVRLSRKTFLNGSASQYFCRSGANVEIAPLEIYRVKPNRDASRIFPTTHTIYHRTGG